MTDDRDYLGHIVDALDDIQRYANVGHDAFLADKMRQDAVIRKLEIVGEAVKHLSDAAKASAPEIPWRRISGMRDRLIHGYFGVDLELVWEVVQEELPPPRDTVMHLSMKPPPSSISPE